MDNNFFTYSSCWLSFGLLNILQKQPNLIVCFDKSCKLLASYLVENQVFRDLQQYYYHDFKNKANPCLISEYEHSEVNII